MINKNAKINKEALERERHSSFVVDLRQKAGAIKDAQKLINKPQFALSFNIPKKSIFATIKKIFSRHKKVGLELAVRDLKLFSKNNKINFPKIHLNFKFGFGKKQSLWQKIVLDKHKILSSKFKIVGRERLAVAENTAIWYRSIFSFMIMLVLIIMPIKLLSYFELLDLSGLEGKVMERSKSALNNLVSAADSVSALDFKEADAEFSKAGQGFLEAQDDLSIISDSLLFLASLSNDPKMKLAAESKKFLAAGAVSSSLGKNLVLATDSLFNSKEIDFLVALESFSKYGRLAVEDAKQLDKIVAGINPDNLPDEYREKFSLLSSQSHILSSNLENFVDAADKMKEILGLSQDKRYLLVFQNNSELRASGGFLGSYALVDLSGGKIKNLEVPGGGSYDTEGAMSVKVKAPKPLWLVNPLWHFWDANWWPDWTKTAQNLMWFYEKSDGPTVDGVISVTPTVVEKLLEVTGPIDLTEEYGVVIDSDNFWETVQKITERKNLEKTHPDDVANLKQSSEAVQSSIPLEQGLENNVDNKPKKIIGDLMTKILEILPKKLDRNNLLKIISAFEDSLAEKQVMFYFTDPKLQAEVSRRNWAGEIKDTSRDYLMVVNTNIAGQKTDRKIEEKIDHLSHVYPDGHIVNTLKITRSHNGIKNEALTGVRNVDWLRVYVPAGSRLISASGFNAPDAKYFEEPDATWEDSKFLENESRATVDSKSGLMVYSENNKTVFAGWVMVDPGQSADITVEYELPFNFFDKNENNGFLNRLNKLLNPESEDLWPYSLLVQKQPGAAPSSFYSRLESPIGISAFWKHPDDLNWQRGWEISDYINSDKYFSVLLKK